MKVLVAYASKAGSTKGIAEFIGEKIRNHGIDVDVQSVGLIPSIGDYDAYVVGSAVYMWHWMKEAREFLSQNRHYMLGKPVWLFSSGPTGHNPTDKKGRDLKEVSGPSEIGELRDWVLPRDHKVFFGAFYSDKLKGATGWFARFIPKEEQGDFRNWAEIESWASQISENLLAQRRLRLTSERLLSY